MTEKLCVVMPVYNEREAIEAVLRKWCAALDALGVDYVIRPYNDGSRDDTLAVMRKVACDLPHVQVRDKPNGGHGNTVLRGYRDATNDGFKWVFQVDSDDEMGPESFAELWSHRDECDFLVGRRAGRKQALPRKIISFVSRLVVRLFYGRSEVWDVNAPYRLMRVLAFAPYFLSIPERTFAPNVILTGVAARVGMRTCEIPVPQHDRMTGEVSIKKWKLLKAAVKSLFQTVVFALSQWTTVDWMRLVLYGFMLLVLVVMLPLAVQTGWRDGLFDFQWDSAKLLMMGENPYLWSLQGRAFIGDEVVAANQVPSCLFLLAPWTYIPSFCASKVWALSNLLFVGISLFFIRRIWFNDGKRRLLDFPFVALAMLSMGATHVVIGNGQHLLFSLAFFFAGYYYALRRSCVVSGVMIALSLFKYTTIFPLLLVFVFIRALRPLVIAAVIHLVLTVLAGIRTGCLPHELILQSFQVSQLQMGQGVGDVASLLSMCGVVSYGNYAVFGYMFFGALFLLVTFTGRRDALLKLSIYAVGSNYFCYHRGYDFVVWIIPIVYMTRLMGSRDLMSRVFVCTTFVCVGYVCYMPVRLVQVLCPCILSPWISLGLQYLWFFELLIMNWCRVRDPALDAFPAVKK